MVTKTDSSLIVHDGSTIKDALDKAKPVVDYVALRAYSGAATQVRITSNGIAGFFYYDSGDTVSTDNGGTIIVGTDGRRWKRDYIGTINIEWFGAVGDGVKNNTTEIQSAINYAESTISVNTTAWAFGKTRELYVPDGVFVVTSLQISSPIKIVGGTNTASIIKSDGSDAPIIKVRGKLNGTTLFESQSTRLENLCILGTETSGYEHDLISTNQIGVKLEYIVGRNQPVIDIIGCNIRQCKSHGVYLETTVSAKIIGCDIILNTGDGVYLTGDYNTDTIITHNKIRRNRIGVNVSPNAGKYITTGRIINNLIESNRNGTGPAGSATRPAVGIKLLRTQNLVISGNYFERHLNDIYFQTNVSFNTIQDNYFDKSSEVISGYASEVPVVRRICPIYMDGAENQGNKISKNMLYVPAKPAASTDENWGTASWGATYPPIHMAPGSFTEITENLARDNTTGAPSDSIYSGGNKTYYRGIYLNSASRETVKEIAEEFIRRCTFQTSFSSKNTRESETTISYDVPVELYVHPQVMSDAFKRKFNSAQRNTDGSLSSEVTAFGVNAYGDLALPLGRPLAFQIAAGNYFVRQYVGTAIPSSGTYSTGDIIWNRSPSVGNPVGWICTALGTPGTWVPFGQTGTLTSVSATPAFVGQTASVGGVGYFATGTSSAADWKQITN